MTSSETFRGFKHWERCPVCGAKLVDGLDFEGYALLYGDDAAQEAFGVDLCRSGIVEVGA